MEQLFSWAISNQPLLVGLGVVFFMGIMCAWVLVQDLEEHEENDPVDTDSDIM